MASGDLADLRLSLQQKGYGTDTATAQTSMLNSVYRRIVGMRRWWFLDRYNDTSLSAVVGQQAYTLTSISDLLHIDAVRLEFGETRLPGLAYLQPLKFAEIAHLDHDNGEPRYWTLVNSFLQLYPRPDKAYQIYLDYVKDPPDLVADDDLPVIPLAYSDALVWGAIRELTFRERDTEGWALANTEYATRIADMTHQDGLRQRQTPSEVVYTGEIDAVNSGFETSVGRWLSW